MAPQLVNSVMAGSDDTSFEVGVEWAEDYPGIDLQWAQENADGLYNRLGELNPPARIKIVSYPTTDFYSRSHGKATDQDLPNEWWLQQGYEFKVTGSAFTYEWTEYLAKGTHYVEYAASGYVPNYAWHAKIYVNDVLMAEGDVGRYNHLRAYFNTGWTKRYSLGNSQAWEKDFEKASVGGIDSSYADSLDFAWFGGHGSPILFSFPANHDGGDGNWETVLHYSEANWGDLDMEWIVIHACSILEDNWTPDVFQRWGTPVMKGVHAIFSFESSTLDTPIWTWYPFFWESAGKRFVNYMTTPYTLGYAWERTTIDWQPSEYQGVQIWAAILAVQDSSTGYIEWNDYLPGYGSVGPDIDNPAAFAWRHWQC